MSTPSRFRNNIFQAPGLIACSIFLPIATILFYVILPYNKPRVLEVNWTNNLNTYEMKWLDKIKNKNYKNFNLNGGDVKDLKMLQDIEKEIRALKSSKDTSNGVHIHFSPTTKYWAVVHTLNILEKVEHWDCALHEDDVWVFKRPESPHVYY